MPRNAIALGMFLFAGSCWAQLSGNATLVSNYWYRGISLSNDNPAAQVGIGFDHTSGWYAGAVGSSVELNDQTKRGLQILTYAGYARRASADSSWEAGISYSAFSNA